MISQPIPWPNVIVFVAFFAMMLGIVYTLIKNPPE